MLNWFHNLGVRTKLVLIYSTVLAVVLFMGGALVYAHIAAIIETQTGNGGASIHPSELYTALQSLRGWLIGFFLLLLGIVVGVSHMVGTAIARPLRELAACFQAGAQGDYGVRSVRNSRDETGRMGDYFNKFMERLEEHTEQMERAVAERTEELVLLNGQYLREIEEKSRAGSLLRQQLAFLDTLLSTIPSPVFYRDREGRFMGGNRSFAGDVLGVDPERVRGRTIDDFPAVYSPQVVNRVRESDAHVLRSGVRVKEEAQLFCADGQPHDFVTEKVPFHDAEGNRIGIIGVMSDITERKHGEQARALLEKATERVSSAVVIVEAGSDRVRYVNGRFEEDMGYDRADVLGENYQKFWETARGDNPFSSIFSIVNVKSVWAGRLTNVRKDGSVYETESSVTCIHDDDGRIAWYVIVQQDITEKVRMEMQLLQAQKLESIGQLAAGIAHEINSPIQFVGDNLRFVHDAVNDMLGIIESCDCLIRDETEAAREKRRAADLQANDVRNRMEKADVGFIRDELPKALEQAQDGVERITAIVRAMKEFSHPGKREKQLADINHAIQNTLTVTRNEWKYVAEVELELDPALPQIRCLPAELNQVFMNIIVNAAHAIDESLCRGVRSEGTSQPCAPSEKGRIHIATRRDGEQVIIRIADSGVGIPKERQRLIFDPFYTTKAVGKGTGQGLAIARDVVVNKHQGTLEVESEPGSGAVFTISLPV